MLPSYIKSLRLICQRTGSSSLAELMSSDANFDYLCGEQLDLQAILSVFLAAFCGFGTAIVGTIVLNGIVKLIRNSREASPLEQSSEPPRQT